LRGHIGVHEAEGQGLERCAAEELTRIALSPGRARTGRVDWRQIRDSPTVPVQ
jgi:hypothetical protein